MRFNIFIKDGVVFFNVFVCNVLQNGDTPLMRAVRSRSAEMVALLLERKARVNVADARGDTALHIAMRARSKVTSVARRY